MCVCLSFSWVWWVLALWFLWILALLFLWVLAFWLLAFCLSLFTPSSGHSSDRWPDSVVFWLTEIKKTSFHCHMLEREPFCELLRCTFCRVTRWKNACRRMCHYDESVEAYVSYVSHVSLYSRPASHLKHSVTDAIFLCYQESYF